MCEHNFEHYKTEGYRQSVGYRSTKCVSIDYFFCTKCLEQKEIKKQETFAQSEELPDWAKAIKRFIPD